MNKKISPSLSVPSAESHTPVKGTQRAMPPKRKSPAAATAVAPAASPRKTRSMAAGKRGEDAPAVTAKKEAEAAEHKGRKKAKKEDAAAVVEEEEAVPQPAVATQKGRKKGKKEVAAAAAVVEEEKGDGGAVVQEGKRVIVEACTQCQQFKKRALKVKEDLESAVLGVSVKINPEKPRRGCLEICEEGGEVFISLLNMPRPFTAMRKLDMDEVIKDIAEKLS